MYLKKIFKYILGLTFTIFSKLKLNRLVAWLFCALIRELKYSGNTNKTYKYTILVLPRIIFKEDVVSCFEGNNDYRLLQAYSNSIKSISAAYLPRIINDMFYLTDIPEIERKKLEYREFLIRVFRIVTKIYNIDAIVTGNFGYYAEREFAAALEEINIPFIAMHKENLKTKGREYFSYSIYKYRRGPFTGRKIFVYNEIERQLQINSGVITPDKVIICGMPRLDNLHNWRIQNSYKNTANKKKGCLLLFSFHEKTILPLIKIDTPTYENGSFDGVESLSWNEVATLTHIAIKKFAQRYPEIEVIIKTKDRERDWIQLHKMLGNKDPIPDNIQLVFGGDPYELIKKSTVICGFNSTVLIESLAVGKPIIVPRYAEVLDSKMKDYILDLEDAVEYADSPDELINKIYKNINSEYKVPDKLSKESIKILNKWVGNSDGKAGERVCSATTRIIEDSRTSKRVNIN